MTDAASIERPAGLTTGDFTAADEPLRLFGAWLAEAERAEPVNPNAMTLATVDRDGMPNARMVLLKGFDERGFVFYTNLGGVKGRELSATPMHKDASGWRATVSLPPGRYEYRFFVDGQWLSDPTAKETVGNDFGGTNSSSCASIM